MTSWDEKYKMEYFLPYGKYKTIGHIRYNGRNLYQIQATKNFADVKIGDKGGYIEKESNLSHGGNCWIYDDAKAYDNAKVTDNAKLYNQSEAYGQAVIKDNAALYSKSKVHDYATITGNAKICDAADISDMASVGGDSEVTWQTLIFGKAIVSGKSSVRGNSVLFGNTNVTDSTIIEGKLGGTSHFTKSYVSYASIEVGEFYKADIRNNSDYIAIYSSSSDSIGHFTFYKDLQGKIVVKMTGWDSYDLSEFENRVMKKYKGSDYYKELELLLKLAKTRLLGAG